MKKQLKSITLLFTILFFTMDGLTQTSIIKGTVVNETNNEPIPFVNLVIQGTNTGASTDENGKFVIDDLAVGIYNIDVSAIGYARKTIYEIQTYNTKPIELNIGLKENVTELEGVEIEASVSRKDESYTSIQSVGYSEIIRTPGGNRDVSKTVQTLPGVASIDGFRNDVIIRGGASAENSYYVDGIKLSTINHFSTQGTGGGVWGILNADLIENVDLYTGSFPVDRGDALSGIFDIKLKRGNTEKLRTNVVFGSSDLAVSLNGPLSKKTSFIFSGRQAYLSASFKALDFAFLPNYRDGLLKIDHQLNDKNSLTFIFIGTDDTSELNEDANTDPETDQGEQNLVILDFAPEFQQSSYSTGAIYKRYYDKGNLKLTVNRSFIRNQQDKYFNNDDSSEDNRLLDYTSDEIENIIRLENKYVNNGYSVVAGAEANLTEFTTNSTARVSDPSGTLINRNYDTDIDFMQYSAFASVTKGFFENRLNLTAGVRSEFSDYNANMENALEQVSPRFLASYQLSTTLKLSASVARYYQQPAFTILGFKDSTSTLANQSNLEYIQSDHLIAGIEYLNNNGLSITLEGFYKLYDNYPFLLTDSISFINVGTVSFGAIGNEPANSSSEVRTYGSEISVRQRLRNGFFGLATYTYSRSESKDKNGDYQSTSWDFQHILNITAGKKLKKNWEIGVKFRLSGGAPFTPYDVATSSLISVWDVEGQGLFDYDRLNEERTDIIHQMDIRIDKRYFFKKWSLNFYFDLQNIYNNQTGLPPFLSTVRDADGNSLVSTTDPTRYQTRLTDNVQPPFFPAIGFIAEF